MLNGHRNMFFKASSEMSKIGFNNYQLFMIISKTGGENKWEDSKKLIETWKSNTPPRTKTNKRGMTWRDEEDLDKENHVKSCPFLKLVDSINIQIQFIIP